ncbi:OsmC family protein [Alicyclobacillus shizuokensis]|uniref:OsmC family protein n=1 Tax=Alicyclobacillus shizuokensis TaxID=392014 RepID=UPI00082D4828|nr:OsmC family protein [Alicyclobacillus shizuokensis]MCL6627618.1 OsmC family protein [Alicyclobacillus shizuokensis]
MTERLTYTVSGQWSGDRDGVGALRLGDETTAQFSMPRNLGGCGIGTNPEELLLSAAASCYLLTLAILLRNRQIPYHRIEVESTGYVENEGGLRYDRIVHLPTVYVSDLRDEQRILQLAEHAELTCMVSSALRGNVRVGVRPRVVCGAASR